MSDSTTALDRWREIVGNGTTETSDANTSTTALDRWRNIVKNKEQLLEKMRTSSSLRDMSIGQSMQRLHKDVGDMMRSNPIHAYEYLTTDENVEDTAPTSMQMPYMFGEELADDNAKETESGIASSAVVGDKPMDTALRGYNLRKGITQAYDATPNEDYLAQRESISAQMLEQLPKDDKGNYIIGGYEYNLPQANTIMRQVVDETVHPMLVKNNTRYRDDFFIKSYGKTYNEVLDDFVVRLNDLQERLNKTIVTAPSLNRRVGGVYEGGTPSEVRGGSAIRNAMEYVESMKNDDFLSGLDQGFDMTSFVTLGLNDLASGYMLNKVLNKVANGDTLSENDQLLYDTYGLQQELEAFSDTFTNGRSFWNSVGEMVGTTAAEQSQFALGMAFPMSGIGMAKMGFKAGAQAIKEGVKQGVVQGIASTAKELAKWGGKALQNVAVVEGKSLAVSPLMPRTWSDYLNKLNAQYLINSEGNIVYRPIDKGKGYWEAMVSTANEISSEVFGAKVLSPLFSMGKRGISRLMGVEKLMNNTRVGRYVAGKVDDMRLNPKMRYAANLAGYAGDIPSEVLSEAFGDLSTAIMIDGINSPSMQELGTKEYWQKLVGMSLIYGGAVHSVGATSNFVGEGRTLRMLGDTKRRALGNIESKELYNSLVKISSMEDLNSAAEELAQLSGYSRTDMAYALDYIRAEYASQAILGATEEDSRMRRFAATAQYLTDRAYRNSSNFTHESLIVEGLNEKGEKVSIIEGNYSNPKEEDMLLVRNAQGDVVPMLASNITTYSEYSLASSMEMAYRSMFDTEVNVAKLLSTQEAINTLSNPTKEDVINIMQENGYGIYPEGAPVILTDGTAGVIDAITEEGKYRVSIDNEGTMQLVEVGMLDIFQAAEEVAMAQRSLHDTSTPTDVVSSEPSNADTNISATTPSIPFEVGSIVATAEGDARVMYVDAERGVVGLNYNTEEKQRGDEAQLIELPISELMPAEEETVSPEEEAPAPKTIPMREDGSVDYDAIDDADMFAEQIATDKGVEQSIPFVQRMRTAAAKQVEKLRAKGEDITSPNEAIDNDNAVAHMERKVQMYDDALAFLEAKMPKEEAVAPSVAEVSAPIEIAEEKSVGLIDNEYTAKLSDNVRRTMDAMATALGVRVRFVDEVRTQEGALANADIIGNEVRISWEYRDKAVNFLMGHEFTHRMQDLAPEAYKAFKQSVIDYVGEEAWSNEIERQRALYERHGKDVDIEVLEDESIADFVGKMVEEKDVFNTYLAKNSGNRTLLQAIADVFRSLRDMLRNIGNIGKAKRLNQMLKQLDRLIADAKASKERSTKVESAEGTEAKFSARLSDRQIATIIEAMKANAEIAPQIELTPENWTAEFGAEGVVSTPIGEVKMGSNQYQKMEQPDRRTKLGMVKPTLTNPDVIIEELSNPKDGRVPERNSSYVFVKAFTNADGTRDYMFTSVSNLRDGIEIVMSNQEKETPRIKRLLKEGKLAYINKATLPSEFTASAQGDQSTIPSEVSYSESKDTTSSPNMQEERVKFSLRELDAPYLDAVERGDMETAQRMVLEAAKRAMPNTKVVDENGDPRVVYHGSNAQFTVFDTAKIGSTTGTADGRGFYFTTDKDYARGFVTPSGKLFGVFLNIENPLSYDRKTITKAQLKKILKEADKVEFAQEGEHYMLSNYADYTVVGIDRAINEASNLEYGYADNDVELIGSLIGGSGSFELIMNAVQKVTGKSGMIAPKDNDTTHYIATNPSLIKSADPVTYDDNGNVIPLSERFNPEKEDIRYSLRQPTFYSNAEYAVRGIKQEKATPEQWLKMIEKNGGLKAGEDKWLGLSEWLKASDKKTLTKDEVLQYIAKNDIQIEEVEYAQFGPGLIDEATRKLEAEMREIGIDAMRDKYDGFDDLFEVYNGELLWSENMASEGEYEDFIIDNNIVDVNAQANAINETRLNYTTNGLDNKREIALVVPTIEPYNTQDEVHFGDAGGGRAVAWIRFGETADADGKRVLVIDEIQSKRHQEGREKGYISAEEKAKIDAIRKQRDEFSMMRRDWDYRTGQAWRQFQSGEISEQEYNRLWDTQFDAEKKRLDEIEKSINTEVNVYDTFTKIPSAPFEKNWAELAMKRMLRYAAENGFDKVAWTTGDQQAERYNLGTKVNHIHIIPSQEERYVSISPIGGRIIETPTAPDSDIISSGEYKGKSLSEVYGKTLAEKIMSVEIGADERISGDGLRIGGEGMKGFYDQMLPSFVRKYAKKWGATVGEVTMPDLEENNTMHAVDVTPAMRESVMQGQPKFSLRTINELQGALDLFDKTSDIATFANTVKDISEGVGGNDYLRNIVLDYDEFGEEYFVDGIRRLLELVGGTPTPYTAGGVRFSLREVNDRFNEELATLTEENKDKVNLSLGMPSDILLAAGVVNKPMKLYGAKLWAKSQKHGYKVSDLRDLPKNVAAPIAIFKGSTDGSHAVLTEIKVGEDNVLATLSVGKGGEDIDFNIISSVYGKQGDNVVKWIDDGKLEYVDKEKVLNYLHHSAPIAEALSNPRLISTTKIIQNFENPKIEPIFSLRERISDIIDSYDFDTESYGSIADVADAVEAIVMDSDEDTTALENILNDFRAAQDDARAWGNRMDSGGEEVFETALRSYASAGEGRYSMPDVPFFEDEGEIVSFDDIKDTPKSERIIRVAPRTTEERVREYIESRHLARVKRIREEARAEVALTRERYSEDNQRNSTAISNARGFAAKIDLILGDTAHDTLPLYDQALILIAQGDVKIRWESDGAKKGLAAEMGYKEGEKKAYRQITSGATKSFEGYVHDWWQSISGYEKGIDTQDMRNALIDALSEASTQSRAFAKLRNMYDKAKEQRDNAIYDIEARRDMLLADEEARYKEELAEFDNTPNKRGFLRQVEQDMARIDDLGAMDELVRHLDASIADMKRKIDRAETKLVAERQKHFDKRKELLRDVYSSITLSKSTVLEVINKMQALRYNSQELTWIINNINSARSAKDVENIATRVRNIALTVLIREQRNAMNKSLNLRLPNGELLETWVYEQQQSGVISATEAKRILNGMWRGVNNKGVAVAKYVDDNTRKTMEKLRNMVYSISKRKKVDSEKIDAEGNPIYTFEPAEENTMDVNEMRKANTEAIIELNQIADDEKTDAQRTELSARYLYTYYLDIVEAKQEVAEARAVMNGVYEEAEAEGATRSEIYRSMAEKRADLVVAKEEYLKALGTFNGELEATITKGRDGYKSFRENEARHERDIVVLGLNAVGRPKEVEKTPIRGWDKARAKFRNTINNPYWSFQTVVREIDHLSPNGMGKFYEYFMYSAQGATDNFTARQINHVTRIGHKVCDIFGFKDKDIASALLLIQRRANENIIGNIRIKEGVDTTGQPLPAKTQPLTIANSMYILAMWQQDRYQRGLKKAGITQEMIDNVRNLIASQPDGEKYLKFMEWVNDKLLPDTRVEYDIVYKKMFGTSMDAEINYFPAKVVNYQRDEDFNADAGKIGELYVTGIIQRKSTAALPDTASDYFAVLMEHVQSMDHWAAFAELHRDLKYLANSNAFKEAIVAYMPGVKGKGERDGAGSLFEIFVRQSAILLDRYKPKADTADRILKMLTRNWATSNIAFRLSTAIKQFASKPLFAVYAWDRRCLAEYLKWMQRYRVAYKWAIENSPMFRARVDRGDMGQEFLSRNISKQGTLINYEPKWKRVIKDIDDFLDKGRKIGMAPNVFVDAISSAVGLRSIYEFEVRRMTEDGKKPLTEEIKKRALIKAEMAVNETQQSSESAYISSVQMDKNIIATALATYQNQPFAMHRKRVSGAQELWRQMFDKEYKNKMRFLHRNAKEYKSVLRKARSQAYAELLQGVLGDMLFQFMGSAMGTMAMACAGIDDDDIWEDMVCSALGGTLLATAFGGFYGGGLIISLAGGFINASSGISNSLMPSVTAIWNDLTDLWRQFKNGELDLGVYNALNIVSKYRYGVDGETLLNMARGIEGLIERSGDVEAAMHIINMPKSQIRIVSGHRREGETVKQYIERVARAETLMRNSLMSGLVDEDDNIIKDDILNGIGGTTDYRLGQMHKKYYEEYGLGVRREYLTKKERESYAEVDEAYTEIIEKFGWKPTQYPRERDESKYDGTELEDVYKDIYWLAYDIRAIQQDLDRWIGTDEGYIEALKEKHEYQVELINKYDEFKR